MKKSIFSPESLQVLKSYGATERQYLIWAQSRFTSASFKAGLVISALVAIAAGYMGYRAYLNDPLTGWGTFAIGGFITMIFLVSAFRMKHGGPNYAEDKAFPGGFESIDVLRRTSLDFMKKLKPRDWETIKQVNVKEYEAKEAAKRPGIRSGVTKERVERLTRLKNRIKKIGLYGLIPFTIAIIVVPNYFTPTTEWRYLLMTVIGVAFMVPVIGLHTWLFLYGYLGFLKREIKMHAEYTEFDTLHYGKSATVLSVIAMIAAVISFAAFMIIPIGLILEWH